MALVSPLTLIAGTPVPRFGVAGVDQFDLPEIESSVATRNVHADAAATTVNVATGANVTTLNIGTGAGAGDNITIGGAGSTSTVNGSLTVQQNLTVNGTTTTVNTTNLTVSDALIYANAGGLDPSFAGMAWDQGAALDVIQVWNPTDNRIEFGRFNTVGGTTVPAAALATTTTIRSNNLVLQGGDITSETGVSLDLAATGAGVTVTADPATAAASVVISANNATGDVTFQARGIGSPIPLNSTADPTLDTTAQNLVGAINEVLATIPGSQNLSSVLATGNTTGANDIIWSAGQDALWATDGNGNIGAVGANRPGTVYVLTEVLVGNSVSITTAAVTGSTTLTVASTAGALTLQSAGAGTTMQPAVNAAGAGFAVTIAGGQSTQAAAAGGSVSINGGGPGAGGTAGVVNVGNTVNTSQVNLGTGGAAVVVGAVGSTTTFASGSTVNYAGTTFLGVVLSQILANGNTTGANNVVISSGAEIIGAPGAAGPGQIATIRGGVGDTNQNGGNAQLLGGNGNGSGIGGNALVNGGTGTTAGQVQIGGATSTSAIIVGRATGVPITIRSGTGQDILFDSRGNTPLSYNDATNVNLVGAVFTGVTSVVGAFNALAAGATASNLTTTFTNGNGGAIIQGQAVYVTTTDDTVDLATATADNINARVVAFVVPASIANAASGDFVTHGTATVRFVTGLTLAAGDVVYLSTTAGSVTNVAPNVAGNIVQSVGYVRDTLTYDGAADLLAEIEIQWGNRALV